MEIVLEYCAMWNYEPQAVSLTAKLLPRFKQSVGRLVLVPSKGGCFEVTVGKTKVYSKLQTGEFPDEDQLLGAIARILG